MSDRLQILLSVLAMAVGLVVAFLGAVRVIAGDQTGLRERSPLPGVVMFCIGCVLIVGDLWVMSS